MTDKKHSPSYVAELCARGVQLFRDHRSDCSSESVAHRAIASNLVCSSFSPRDWYRRAAHDAGELSGLLNVIDEFGRDCLAAIVDTSL